MKQVAVNINSNDIVVTNSLRRFVEERTKLILSRNSALIDLKVELGLDEEAGPEASVFALGFAVLPDQEVIASSVSKNTYSALGSMIHKLEYELRDVRRLKQFQSKPIDRIKFGSKIPKERFSRPGFSNDRELNNSNSFPVNQEAH
ncbi:hypothetical protein [Pelagicoccus sp. SDUM812002]|uniref:hypothetical protein n=1 Tax=Pelagicoccus sp. SDUM812002 TaxID=3041266 RepID=UPI00280EA85A|nr:hypothetical protein [Pelagicoccus sp. SDUM812002]MDQ8184595.1 hypothetical protein [Pelagicoccus sp. SDUM812002]